LVSDYSGLRAWKELHYLVTRKLSIHLDGILGAQYVFRGTLGIPGKQKQSEKKLSKMDLSL
jgi:hypothetical protein